MPFTASIGILYHDAWTVEPKRKSVPIKKSVPIDRPTHLLLFMFISRVTEFVTKYFWMRIIQLSEGEGVSNIYSNTARGHRSDLFLTRWRLNYPIQVMKYGMISALAKSMKNAQTKGTMIKAWCELPYFCATADMFAIAVENRTFVTNRKEE